MICYILVIFMRREWGRYNDPKERGWYAVHYSWDSNEGSFINVLFSDGVKWVYDISLPIFEICGPFVGEEEAKSWANKNDVTF